MNKTELKTLIKNKEFKSTDGTDYEFIPENTIRLKNNPRTAVHYEIEETQDGKFYLKHNGLLGSEHILIEIINNPMRLEFTMSKLNSGEFIGTWVEQQNSDL